VSIIREAEACLKSIQEKRLADAEFRASEVVEFLYQYAPELVNGRKQKRRQPGLSRKGVEGRRKKNRTRSDEVVNLARGLHSHDPQKKRSEIVREAHAILKEKSLFSLLSG